MKYSCVVVILILCAIIVPVKSGILDWIFGDPLEDAAMHLNVAAQVLAGAVDRGSLRWTQSSRMFGYIIYCCVVVCILYKISDKPMKEMRFVIVGLSISTLFIVTYVDIQPAPLSSQSDIQNDASVRLLQQQVKDNRKLLDELKSQHISTISRLNTVETNLNSTLNIVLNLSKSIDHIQNRVNDLESSLKKIPKLPIPISYGFNGAQNRQDCLPLRDVVSTFGDGKFFITDALLYKDAQCNDPIRITQDQSVHNANYFCAVMGTWNQWPTETFKLCGGIETYYTKGLITGLLFKL